MITRISPLVGNEAFWARWDALNAGATHDHPLLQSRFLQPMLAVFEEDGTAFLDGDAAQFDNAVLVSHRRRLGGLIAGCLHPAQTQINLSLVTDSSARFLQDCVNALPIAAQRLDCFAVDARYQAPLAGAGVGRVRSVRGHNMSISIGNDFDSYWAGRSKNLRKNMNRYANRCSRNFPDIELRTIVSATDMTMAIARYGFLEARGWKGHAGTAIHPANQQGEFYETVLAAFAGTGEARVYELWAGDRMLASRLCIGNNDMLVILKTTFDEEAREIAPGRVLLRMMLEQLFETGRQLSLEFYTNATPEQLAWATDEHPIYDVSVYRHAWVPQVLRRSRNSTSPRHRA